MGRQAGPQPLFKSADGQVFVHGKGATYQARLFTLHVHSMKASSTYLLHACQVMLEPMGAMFFCAFQPKVQANGDTPPGPSMFVPPTREDSGGVTPPLVTANSRLPLGRLHLATDQVWLFPSLFLVAVHSLGFRALMGLCALQASDDGSKCNLLEEDERTEYEYHSASQSAVGTAPPLSSGGDSVSARAPADAANDRYESMMREAMSSMRRPYRTEQDVRSALSNGPGPRSRPPLPPGTTNGRQTAGKSRSYDVLSGRLAHPRTMQTPAQPTGYATGDSGLDTSAGSASTAVPPVYYYPQRQTLPSSHSDASLQDSRTKPLSFTQAVELHDSLTSADSDNRGSSGSRNEVAV